MVDTGKYPLSVLINPCGGASCRAFRTEEPDAISLRESFDEAVMFATVRRLLGGNAL